MKNPLRLVALAFLVLGLNGCGLKGPLFYPPAEKPATKPKPAKAAQTPAATANPGSGASSSSTTVQP